MSNSICKHLRSPALNKFLFTVIGAIKGFLLSNGLKILNKKIYFIFYSSRNLSLKKFFTVFDDCKNLI